MFRFGKKAPPPAAVPNNTKGNSGGSKERVNDKLASLGLIGIPGLDGGDDSDISEGDLENELLEMLGEEDNDNGSLDEAKELQMLLQEDSVPEQPPPVPVRRKTEQVQQKSDPEEHIQRVTAPSPAVDAQSRENITAPPADIFNAPPAPTTVLEALEQRLDKYKSEADKAKSSNDEAKSRRLGRIVKQYQDAIKAHKSGRPVAYEELPNPPGFSPIPVAPSQPPLATTTPHIAQAPNLTDAIQKPSPPKLPKPTTSGSVYIGENEPELTLQQKQLNTILTRQKQFKEAALNAKQRGDIEQAKEFLRTAKGLETLVEASQTGLPVDMATLPAAPGTAATLEPEKTEKVQQSSESESHIQRPPAPPYVVEAPLRENTESQTFPADIFNAPPPPSSVLEALEQRLDKYKSEADKAKSSDDGAKSRRLGRIVKQYQDAIKAHKSGRPVAYEELPTPPGFSPIPVAPAQPPSATPTPHIAPAHGLTDAVRKPSPPKPTTSGSIYRGENKPATKLTLQEKQLNTILTRQKQFKEAALNAKQRGDIEQAKEFLRTAKGFDKLIEVSQAGLPVDMATLPAAPEAVAQLEAEDFELVTSSDCIQATGSVAEIFEKLELDLKEQLKTCMRTRDHFKSIGDIASANRFEQMALESKRDLDAIRLAVKKGDAMPKYHYENRIFSITECNSDLGEDDIEISILKGINFKVANPEAVDTFIKVELPYPSAEELQTTKTVVVKNSNSPEYNATYKMSVNRSARNFPRFIHRHGFKLEIWSKGGLFSRSTLIGVAAVKLQPLETKCTLHDAFDIMDGRKVVGKIEAKVRLREPVLTKEISQKKYKWLSIDRV